MANQPKRYPTFYSRAFVPSKKFDNVLIPSTVRELSSVNNGSGMGSIHLQEIATEKGLK